jgi:hypothetical protein
MKKNHFSGVGLNKFADDGYSRTICQMSVDGCYYTYHHVRKKEILDKHLKEMHDDNGAYDELVHTINS